LEKKKNPCGCSDSDEYNGGGGSFSIYFGFFDFSTAHWGWGFGFDFFDDGYFGSGGDGGVSSNIPPISTTPVLTLPPIDHIAELNKITDTNSNTRAKIDEYKGNLDYLFEEGVEFKANGGMYPAQNNVYNGVKFADVDKYGANPITRIHKHHNELHSILSFEDIYGMAVFFDQKKQIDPNNANNITSVMVSKTGLHALRVADSKKTKSYYIYMLSKNHGGAKHHKSVYEDYVVKNTKKKCGDSCMLIDFENWLMEYFIEYFKWLDCGFDYYFAPHPADSDGNYIWVKQN